MRYSIAIMLAAVAMFWILSRSGQDAGTVPGKINLEFWTYKSGESLEKSTRYWKSVAEDFARANPGIRVRVIADVDHPNYAQIVGTRMIAGNPPDILIVDDNMMPELNAERQLAALEELIRNDPTYHTADFPSSMVGDGYVGDVRYSIPWYGGYLCLLYRTDLFEQAGLNPPRTWEELISVCQVIRRKFGIEHPFGTSPSSSFLLMPWLWQNSGEILSDDLRTIRYGEPAAIGAVQFMHDLIYKHKVIDPLLAQGLMPDKLWGAGKVAMIIEGSWALSYIDDNYPQWKGKWRAAQLPAGRTPFVFYGGQHLVMSAACRHKEEAWKFMSFAVRPDMQERWSDIVGSPPANVQVFQSSSFATNHPEYMRMKDTPSRGKNNPLFPLFTKIWNNFENNVLQVVMPDPDADIPEAMRANAGKTQKILDAYWRTNPYFVQGRKL